MAAGAGQGAAASRIEALLAPLDAGDRALVVQGLEQLVRGLRAEGKGRATGREPQVRVAASPNKMVKVIRSQGPKRNKKRDRKANEIAHGAQGGRDMA